MATKFKNPYSGNEEETCSVSFGSMADSASVHDAQTEAQFNKSKLMGEWGVLKAKVAKGEIPKGTKILTFEGDDTSGYAYVGDSKTIRLKVFPGSGKPALDFGWSDVSQGAYFKSQGFKFSIPKSADASPSSSQVAAPTPMPAVAQTSKSVGSMTDEDVAAMFVQIKDKLATSKGVNIKGANPDLDQEVYKAISSQIGYTPAEVKGKIDAYKATGKKLSSLKKKTLKKGSEPVSVAPATPVNPNPVSAPNGVPTVASVPVVNKVTAVVGDKVASKPKAFYSDEDIAAAYIMAKDKIVADSNGKWTLYSKSDEMDAAIYGAVEAQTGYTAAKTKHSIALYLSEPGKKLSTLKKSLIKQGLMKAEADTLKKKATPTQVLGDINAKAAAGYTPTPDPVLGDVAQNKEPTKKAKEKASKDGDISGISEDDQKYLYDAFKLGAGKYLTDSPGTIYDNLIATAAKASSDGKGTFTALQLLRVVDAYGAKKFGVDNGNLFEKKVVEFLVTPEGKKHIEDGKAKALKAAADAKAKAEALKIAEEHKKNAPPLPADSALFKSVSATDVREWQGRQKPWTLDQKEALRTYTGSSYMEINGRMRETKSYGGSFARVDKLIKDARAGMRPLEENMVVHRGTSAASFGLKEHGENDQLHGLVGKKFKQSGFSSASFGEKAAFTRQVTLHIECPPGTPAAYLKGISRSPNENEILLDHGIELRVLRVWEEKGVLQNTMYHVQCRIEGWEKP